MEADLNLTAIFVTIFKYEKQQKNYTNNAAEYMCALIYVLILFIYILTSANIF